MNDDHLHRLLDDAATAFQPTPDPARLGAALGATPRRRTTLTVVTGAAVGLALLGGVAAAQWAADEPDRLVTVETTTTTTAKAPKPATTTTVKEVAPATTAASKPAPLPPTTLKPEPPPTTAKPEPPPTTAKPTPPPTTAKPAAPPTTAKPEPPPTTTKPEPPPTTAPAVPWSASQTYGTCGEDPAFDVFFGTVNPGSKVKALSPYGSGSVIAGPDGHWELKVFFPTAPIGETFTVTLMSPQGATEFSFTRTG